MSSTTGPNHRANINAAQQAAEDRAFRERYEAKKERRHTRQVIGGLAAVGAFAIAGNVWAWNRVASEPTITDTRSEDGKSIYRVVDQGDIFEHTFGATVNDEGQPEFIDEDDGETGEISGISDKFAIGGVTALGDAIIIAGGAVIVRRRKEAQREADAQAAAANAAAANAAANPVANPAANPTGGRPSTY